MTPRLAGGVLALAALALDQGSKRWALGALGAEIREPVALTPFVDLRLSWNQGVSFSLFQAHGGGSRALLLSVTLAATLALALWLWRSTRLASALGLGAIVGGALGNGYDRFAYGAVADFLDLHWGVRHFFIFNLADAAINLGVALLFADLMFAGGAKPRPVK